MPKQQSERSVEETERLQGQARSAATKRLREKYPIDWSTFLREEYHARGLEWNPKLTPQERARKTLQELLTDFPNLREELPEYRT